MNRRIKSVLPIICLAIIFTSCQEEEFELSSNTNDMFHIQNGDYIIPVLVRGNTASKKILLYIQGGPGYASLDFAKVDFPQWKNSLENDYAIAYYDQRGTGNKQGNFSQGDLVLSTWIEDLHKVSLFLEKAYGAEIIMMGHSFGGDLMYRYMIAKGSSAVPSKYISIDSPVTTDSDADTLRWDFRREFLFNTANLEISRGKRIPEWNEVLQWLSVTPEIKKLDGDDPYRLMNQWNTYVEELIYVDYPEKTVKVTDYLKIVFASNYNVLPYLNSKYTEELVSRILDEEENDFLMNKLPLIQNQNILVIGGRYDDICPPEELEYVFNQIGSSQKTMSIIDYAGHTPFVDQSNEFYSIIKQFVQ
ncbi:MAG: alpha/beta hydrolase [Bacteroidia bacterium]|jgi:pimeloyl-ACP methyl ester carboxylesterase|nr:alpha/beta hydrolase [Bacteroidota bacterium]MBP9924178.1 alpha/beta hydrolase [Bacteroidia bacterium]